MAMINLGYVSNFQAIALRKYEDSVVEFILKRFGLENVAAELRVQGKNELGFGCLDLARFNRHFETFPMMLRARKWPTEPMYHSDWFRKFYDSKIWSEYYEVLCDYGGEATSDKVGMVFHAPYLDRKLRSLVIHNGPVDTTVAGELFMSFRSGRCFVIEPLTLLLDSIARRWPEPKSEPPSRPRRKPKG